MWLKKIADTIDRFVGPASRAINYAGAGVLVVLMMLIAVHVAGRYFFNLPVPGAVELIEFLMTFVVFLGFGYCAIQQGNVRVDVVVNALPQRLRAVVDAATALLSIGIVTLITWQGVAQAFSLHQSGHVSGVLHVPHYPFLAVLAAGCMVFDLALVAGFFRSLHGVFKK